MVVRGAVCPSRLKVVNTKVQIRHLILVRVIFIHRGTARPKFPQNKMRSGRVSGFRVTGVTGQTERRLAPRHSPQVWMEIARFSDGKRAALGSRSAGFTHAAESDQSKDWCAAAWSERCSSVRRHHAEASASGQSVLLLVFMSWRVLYGKMERCEGAGRCRQREKRGTFYWRRLRETSCVCFLFF
jgi:hypothetical protein